MAKKSTRIVGDRVASFWAKVEKTDACWNWTAALHDYGYGVFSLKRDDGKWRVVRAHRHAWELIRGPIAEGMQLDHICHNRACVNPDHLREVTNKQNHENYLGASQASSTGYRGVYWSSWYERYVVQVTHNGKRHSGGTFTNPEQANERAIELRNQLHTHNDADRIDKKAVA